MADNDNQDNSTTNNNQTDNQARQKQDIQRLLAGQSISPTTSTPAATSTPATPSTSATSSTSATPSSSSNPTVSTSPTLREDKLKLAVSFLSSPKVQTADKSKKTAFLKQKGLTDAEVEEAYRRTGGTASTGTQVSAQPTTSSSPSPTPVSSTLPPIVPTRAPPTRPTQIIYYSEPEPERLTGKRVIALAFIWGIGAVGLTAGLVGIVKGFISPIFNSIAGYQRNRYNDRHDKLSKLNNTLRQHLYEEKDTSGLDGDELSNDGYWSPLLDGQRALMERLERLAQLAQKCPTLHDEPYGKFKNTLLDLKEVLNRPEYNFSTYTPYSMYGSTFANRSNTGFDDAAVQGVKSEIRSFKGMLLSRRNFPAAQIKPPVVTLTTTTTTDPTPASPSSTPVAPAYHPRQRQASYRAELQAKALETNATGSAPNESADAVEVTQDNKGNTTSIEDITETNKEASV